MCGRISRRDGRRKTLGLSNRAEDPVVKISQVKGDPRVVQGFGEEFHAVDALLGGHPRAADQPQQLRRLPDVDRVVAQLDVLLGDLREGLPAVLADGDKSVRLRRGLITEPHRLIIRVDHLEVLVGRDAFHVRLVPKEGALGVDLQPRPPFDGPDELGQPGDLGGVSLTVDDRDVVGLAVLPRDLPEEGLHAADPVDHAPVEKVFYMQHRVLLRLNLTDL